MRFEMSSILDSARPRSIDRREWLAIASVLALVIVAGGCAPRLRVPVDPAAFAGEVVAPDSAQIHSLRSWMASGRLHCRLEGREGRGRIRVILAAPHQLRADMEFSGVFGLFGARSVLWASEEGLVWQEGAELPSPVDADEFFSPVLGRAAGVRDLEGLLFGLPVLWGRWTPDVAIERRDGDYVLTARLADGSEEARLAGHPPVLRRLVRRDANGKVIMDARFDRHQMIGGLAIARRLDVRSPVEGNRLRIDWKRIEPDWPGAREALAWPEVGSSP